MARQIEAYKLRTELAVDARAGAAAMKSFQKDVDNVGQSFKKLGPQIDEAGKKAGAKFGEKFGATATTVITGSFDKLGETLGSIIGTAMAPGIGTAIGSTVGSMVDKVGGAITPLIKQGYELNKMLEQTSVEFTTFAGSAKAAQQYLEGLKKFAHETGTDLNLVVESSEKLYDLTGNLELSTKILRAATDQAADFGGKAETIVAVADALGLVAEKGDLAARDLKTLFKLGIDAKKYLAEATGMSERQIARMIQQGRVRGEVAARVIAEGIERQKGGFAQKLADTTAGGAERRAGVAMQLTEVRGTAEMTRGLGDMYRAVDKVLSSDTANKLVDFLNATAGGMIDFAEKGIMSGINLAQGVAEGVGGAEAVKAVGQSVKDLGGSLLNQFNTFFDIRTPSHVMEREVGIPLGEGIAIGILPGLQNKLQDGNLGRDVTQTIVDFFQKHAAEAIEIMKRTGIPASVTLAQAGLESGFGRSGLTQRAQNYFGIKGRGPAGSVMMRTREETASGQSYFENAPFRAYSSAAESFADHAQFLLGKRYRGALQYANDPGAYTEAIRRAGYATDTKYTQKVTGLISKYGLQQYDVGAGVTPVAVVQWGGAGVGGGFGAPQDIQGAAGMVFGQAPQQTKKATEELGNFVEMVNDTIPVLVDVNIAQDELLKTDTKRDRALARMTSVTLQATTPIEGLTAAVAQNADTSIQLTKEYQDALKKELFTGMSIVTQISGALEQVGGFAPSETVGKKRGLFSKILGVAAPFLSFIPGVGPILSQVAGMASAGLGGNWAGVVQGAASGLAAGGVFRRASSAGTTVGHTAGPVGHRQYGGPVYAGHSYVVGERGQETFTPGRDGYITPHGAGDNLLAVVAELRAAVQHLNTMPAHQVVMNGARGFVRALDHDAGLIRLVSQRQRLA